MIMKDIKEVDITTIESEKWYRLKDVADILHKSSQNIWYLLKRKYFKETRVVGGTPINRRIAIKWQSIIDFVNSLNQ